MAARGTRAAGERVRRIGVFVALPEDDPDTKARVAGFLQELELLGWSEGRNVRIDYRYMSAASADQAHALARELVVLRPDVILAQSTQVTAALQRETSAIPIVFVKIIDRSDQVLPPAYRGRAAISLA